MIEVTLIIPVRNEESTIGLLWESIRSQTIHPTRIIFVDGGSIDQTVKFIRDLTSDDNSVILIETDGAMPGEGRNIGIDAAQTDWIVLTDAGIRLAPNWLELLMRRSQTDQSLDVIYGTYEPIIQTFFDECAAISYVPQRWISSETRHTPFRGPTITSILLRRQVWAKVGGFPRWRASEDLIFMRNVELAAFKIGYEPEAIVHWRMPENLAGLFRKFSLYSTHNVWAGMQAEWHYGIARHYLGYTVSVLIALTIGQHLLLAIPFIAYVARALLSLSRKSEFAFGRSFIPWAANPFRIGLIMLILLTIDMATFGGWLIALCRKKQDVSCQ